MWLTKNEKRVLQFLLENSRLTDTNIAEKLNISSQAVGRIRKELEEEKVIESYRAKLNSNKLGIKVFTLIKISILKESKKKEIEQEIMALKNTIVFIKTMDGDMNYTLIMGFPLLEEMEDFINGETELRKNIIVKEVIPYCQKNVLKNSIRDLLKSTIDQSGIKKTNFELWHDKSQ